ncbi:MAG: hypothetical protein KDD33_11795, partial [Bdellovibrionales bacterium]|nr:hypothetical protein [Bdellovibrionales bacterium]
KEEENRGDFVALKRWVGLMQQQIKEKGGMNQLILELKHLQLDPVIAKDSNPYTGDMHIIRTYKSLPGTRYFHAQYFSEKGGKPQLQHVSFEFRPGPGALKDVVSTLQKTLPEIGVPTEEDKEFYQWHFASDYVLWVKQLGKEDLIGDSFNAYSPDDLGTIRIALELEIHSDDHHASN